MTSRHLAPVLPLLLLAAPVPARPPPLGFSLEAAVPAASGGGAARLTAVASWWLDGDVAAEARIGLGSAGRPAGRGADAPVAALGLRWGPDLGRWRPRLGLDAGLLVPARGVAAVPTAGARLGAELFARRDLSLSVTAGWRWTSGSSAGAEATVGLGYYP